MLGRANKASVEFGDEKTVECYVIVFGAPDAEALLSFESTMNEKLFLRFAGRCRLWQLGTSCAVDQRALAARNALQVVTRLKPWRWPFETHRRCRPHGLCCFLIGINKSKYRAANAQLYAITIVKRGLL